MVLFYILLCFLSILMFVFCFWFFTIFVPMCPCIITMRPMWLLCMWMEGLRFDWRRHLKCHKCGFIKHADTLFVFLQYFFVYFNVISLVNFGRFIVYFIAFSVHVIYFLSLLVYSFVYMLVHNKCLLDCYVTGRHDIVIKDILNVASSNL